MLTLLIYSLINYNKYKLLALIYSATKHKDKETVKGGKQSTYTYIMKVIMAQVLAESKKKTF